MKKGYIHYWANFVKLEKITGYKHLEEIEFHNVFSVAADIFSLGLNVMIYHSDENNIILFVDEKRFQQR